MTLTSTGRRWSRCRPNPTNTPSGSACRVNPRLPCRDRQALLQRAAPADPPGGRSADHRRAPSRFSIAASALPVHRRSARPHPADDPSPSRSPVCIGAIADWTHERIRREAAAVGRQHRHPGRCDFARLRGRTRSRGSAPASASSAWSNAMAPRALTLPAPVRWCSARAPTTPSPPS